MRVYFFPLTSARGIIIDLEGIEQIFGHGGVARLQDVIRQNERKRHLDGKLHTHAHTQHGISY